MVDNSESDWLGCLRSSSNIELLTVLLRSLVPVMWEVKMCRIKLAGVSELISACLASSFILRRYADSFVPFSGFVPKN